MVSGCLKGAPRRSRRLDRSSLPNVRDLGGLALPGGAFTRFGCVLRCGSLASVVPADADWLAGHVGLRLVIDMRTDRERVAAGTPDALTERGVRCVTMPVSTARPYLGGQSFPNWRDYAATYTELALAIGPPLRFVLEALAAGGASPLAFFCTAGKDRTGVLAGVLLWSLGVSRREIANDYALTARALRPRLDDFADVWGRKRLTRTEYARRLETRPAAMHALLAWLNREYSSPRGLLEALEINPSLLDPARATMVETP